MVAGPAHGIPSSIAHGHRLSDGPRCAPSVSADVVLYLTAVPATSIDVERVFSRGRFLLPYTRNRVKGQTMRALMCLGAWSPADLITADHLKASTAQPEVDNDDSDYEMDPGWDAVMTRKGKGKSKAVSKST